MLLEHAFITTAEPEAAFQLAREAMSTLGFQPQEAPIPQALAWTRGVEKARRAKCLHDIPQRVLLSYDRGKLTLAASLQEAPQFAKERKALETYLIALANTIELCIGNAQAFESVRADWDHAQALLTQRDQRRRRNQMWIRIVAAGFAAALVALVIAVARSIP